MIFESKYATVDHIYKRNAAAIELEPMFYRASFGFANSHAGPLTTSFLYALRTHAEALGLGKSGDFSGVVIDSRVHMLMRGMYPCIPGWHHDDVPRDTPSGQPNYDKPAYAAKHLMCVVDADDAPTGALPEFLSGKVEVPYPLADDAVVYAVWDAHINHTSPLRPRAVNSGEIVHFDSSAFHRGTAAKSTGWRWFIRASWGTLVKPENKIRRNANVYMAWSTAGW